MMRLLVISYHFGPDGATGGFRWHGLTQHLVRKGWSFDILTETSPKASSPTMSKVAAEGGLNVHRIQSRSASASLLRRVSSAPAGAREAFRMILGGGRGDRALASSGQVETSPTPVHPDEVRVWAPGHRLPVHARILRELDALADSREMRNWNRVALAKARELMHEQEYRAVIVSSPPHGTQRVGLELARECGIPYVADFRDPCALGLARFSGLQPSVIHRRWLRLEEAILNRAHATIYNTERHRGAVASELRVAFSRAWVVPNAYDEEREADAPDSNIFRIAFAGWLHPFMDLRLLFAAVARMMKRHSELQPDQCRIELIGSGSTFVGHPIRGIAASYGVANLVELAPRMPRGEVVRRLEKASVLVAFGCPHHLCVPMKVFDYARMRGTLVLIGNRDGAMADVAAELGTEVCEPKEPKSIDRRLDQALLQWKSGQLGPAHDLDGRMHRARQADRLHDDLSGLPLRDHRG